MTQPLKTAVMNPCVSVCTYLLLISVSLSGWNDYFFDYTYLFHKWLGSAHSPQKDFGTFIRDFKTFQTMLIKKLSV